MIASLSFVVLVMTAIDAVIEDEFPVTPETANSNGVWLKNQVSSERKLRNFQGWNFTDVQESRLCMHTPNLTKFNARQIFLYSIRL